MTDAHLSHMCAIASKQLTSNFRLLLWCCVRTAGYPLGRSLSWGQWTRSGDVCQRTHALYQAVRLVVASCLKGLKRDTSEKRLVLVWVNDAVGFFFCCYKSQHEKYLIYFLGYFTGRDIRISILCQRKFPNIASLHKDHLNHYVKSIYDEICVPRVSSMMNLGRPSALIWCVSAIWDWELEYAVS